jgi:ribosome-associated toxin RatA of RatAB toxin-antitoxin module
MPQFKIERMVDAPSDVVWDVISDVVGYADIAPNLSKAAIIAGDKLGMERRCWDTRGGTWAETCVLWDEGRAYAMEVDTNDYPYPLTEMQGTWALAERPSGPLITMQFDYKFKYGPVGSLLNRPLRSQFKKICQELLDNWETVIQARLTHQVKQPDLG